MSRSPSSTRSHACELDSTDRPIRYTRYRSSSAPPRLTGRCSSDDYIPPWTLVRHWSETLSRPLWPSEEFCIDDDPADDSDDESDDDEDKNKDASHNDDSDDGSDGGSDSNQGGVAIEDEDGYDSDSSTDFDDSEFGSDLSTLYDDSVCGSDAWSDVEEVDIEPDDFADTRDGEFSSEAAGDNDDEDVSNDEDDEGTASSGVLIVVAEHASRSPDDASRVDGECLLVEECKREEEENS